MRTTIRLDDELLAEIKIIAVRSGRTMTSVIEGALREMLARRQETTARAPVRLTTVSGGGLHRPMGVVDKNTQPLYDRFERGDLVIQKPHEGAERWGKVSLLAAHAN